MQHRPFLNLALTAVLLPFPAKAQIEYCDVASVNEIGECECDSQVRKQLKNYEKNTASNWFPCDSSLSMRTAVAPSFAPTTTRTTPPGRTMTQQGTMDALWTVRYAHIDFTLTFVGMRSAIGVVYGDDVAAFF